MNFPTLKSSFFLFSLLFLCSQIVSADDEIIWRPVSPAELQMKTPQVEPDADAEAIFWEVRLDDKKAGKLSYNHYVRVKIFTERGRERFSKFDIPFLKGKKVENVAARVIKPDGSIVELQPGDIFEREIVRSGNIKIKAKSFAVPAIEPGVIVEYQYKEVFKGDSASGERLIFQRDVPMQKASYYVRPYQGTTLVPSFYNMPEMRFVEDGKGFFVATMTNVPAYKQEPFMPPDDEVRRWALLSYRTFGSIFSWTLLNSGAGQFFTEATKPNKEIKQKAAELAAGSASEEDTLKKIYDFTQKQIKNISFDLTITDEERENIKLKGADDALKRGMANSAYVDLLFASLAKAHGFETYLVISGDRSENFFNPQKYSSQSFVHPAGIAVKVGGQIKYFNPGTPYLPYGRLAWHEEDVAAMLIGENTGVTWKITPLSDETQSPAKRTGKFKLHEDGTLGGTVRMEFEGQQAIIRRRGAFNSSASKREEDIKEEIKKHISSAEISEISIENFSDNSKPLTYVFKVRVPNYAQKTGKRLFLQPGFFEYGTSAAFSSATRINSIYFPYPWSEKDSLEIQLPAGFELDNADVPGTISDPSKIGALDIKISINKTTNSVLYTRNFHFGGGGNILFPVTAYKPLKDLFDAFHKADTHTITLKQSN
jgi:hypothetical protein